MVSFPHATIFQETPMLVFPHHTDPIAQTQPSLVGETWATEVVPRLPATLAVQARTRKAFQRVRGLATPHDLLRGLLAYVLGPLSTRRLGAWAVLVGVADISETAWRKRLRASTPWLLWLLSEWVAPSEVPDPLGVRPRGRILLVDASCLGQPGGTGDDWRLPLAYDFTAGRLGQGQVPDRRGGDHLGRSQWQPGEVIVADRGSGYRRSVALAVRQQADVILRIHPATFPLETEAGEPFAVLRWLRHRGEATRDWHGWGCWQGCRYRVRLVAAKLPPAAGRQARRRQRRTAQKAGRTITAPTCAVAGWILVITTLAAASWPPADVLAVYRARWQGALVFKRRKQLLRLNQIRRTNLTSVEATVRALLIAWALHEETGGPLRALLPTETPIEGTPVSRWLLTGLSLDTVRQQVQGTWSEAQLRTCLPRLRRFLVSSPRRRRHQESAVRAWLDSRATTRPSRQQHVA
jgi:hypothetical protein